MLVSGGRRERGKHDAGVEKTNAAVGFALTRKSGVAEIRQTLESPSWREKSRKG